jgi:hypothetical protein
MEENKSWYASQTVWASILQMAVGVLVGTGMINQAAGSTVVADGPGIIIGIVSGALGLWSLYGRIKATKVIGG